MPKQSDKPAPEVRYWQRRLRSAAFKRELTTVVRRELAALGAERVKDVVNKDLVRRLIREWDTRMLDRTALADLLIEASRPVTRRRRELPHRWLDPQLVADVDAVVAEGVALPADAEEIVAAIMRQDLVRGLFTDIIYSAIVSFYERVNPLFGAMTMRVLEEQIKGFIRYFMPMLQRQATAFVLDTANQRVAVDFARVIIRQLLEQPLPTSWPALPPAQQRKLDALIRHAVGSAKLGAVVRDATLTAWDDLYAMIDDKRVGDLLRLEEQAAWFAEQLVEIVVPALSRTHLLRFLAAEMAGAANPSSQSS